MSLAGVTELLASASAPHRRAVATELGLAPAAPADEIGAALRDRIAAIIGKLSPGARRLAAEAAFLGEATVHESWTGRPSAAVAELERHGLAFAFAFRDSDMLAYRVPSSFCCDPRRAWREMTGAELPCLEAPAAAKQIVLGRSAVRIGRSPHRGSAACADALTVAAWQASLVSGRAPGR
jgi:hypothetical protein